MGATKYVIGQATLSGLAALAEAWGNGAGFHVETAMSCAMFEFTIPALSRGLNVLSSYLDHIERGIGEGKLDGNSVFNARLSPDMFSLGQQFQTACDNAKNGSARLTGKKAPSFGDKEVTVGDFRARVERTQAWLQSFSPVDFEESEGRIIEQDFRRADYSMTGGDYLRAVLLPNFYFHVAMVHGILRHAGLRLGKNDYFGEVPRSDFAMGQQGECKVPAGDYMRFLTSAEASAWIAAHDLPEDPDTHDPTSFYFQFAPQPMDVDLRDVICSLMEDFGPFTGGLLRVTDWIWDEEYDVDPTMRYREAQGESRTLLELPAFLFDEHGVREAAALIALMIERRWTARFYFDSKAATLQLCEGDRVDVYSADAQIEELVRYRLIESGANFTLP